VCKFLELVSYYLRYIDSFSDIADLLQELLAKGAQFELGSWQNECSEALKNGLYSATRRILRLLQCLLMNSNVSLGAILDQDGHVLAYKSRALTSTEKNYSI